MAGPVKVGAHILPVARGVLGVGLALAGASTKSGAAAGLSTTAKKVTFETEGSVWAERAPVLIRFKMVGQTLTLGLGQKTGGESIAADTWTAWLACTGLYEGKDDWYVTAGAEGALDYEVAYV
jgi:hypothetical protein